MIFCFSKINKKSKGFTLIEVLTAISILAIVVVALFKMHLQTISMNNGAVFYTQALFLAQSKITELETKPWDEIVDSSGDFGENFSGYTFNILVNELESEVLDSYANYLKKVDITVLFNENEFTYKIRAYIINN